MTAWPPDGGASITGETLVALRAFGFSESDQLRLRFSFEEAGLRRAVDLAAELRTITPAGVQVRPGRSLLSRGMWTVALTTIPLPVALVVIQLWVDRMQDVADGRTGCRFVGWTPMLDGAGDLPGCAQP